MSLEWPVYDECPFLASSLISSQHCTQPVYIVLRSSEGNLIGDHRSYLARFAGKFDSVTTDSVVVTDETVDVLCFLMRFFHPRGLSEFEDTTFDILLPLAHAAEKSQVWGAMVVRKFRLS